MSDKSEVFEAIKSVITSQKGGVLLKDINRDYRNLVGEHIPYKRLGYQLIEELVDDISEIQSYQNGDGEVVFVNKGKNCEHLVKLISKQKATKNSKCKPSVKGISQKLVNPRRFDVGEKVKPRYEHKQVYNENSTYMLKRGFGDRADVREERFSKSTEYLRNVGLRQKHNPHSRKSDAYFSYEFSGQKGREWKPREGRFDDTLQVESQQDSYDRTYQYKSSKVLDSRENTHGVYRLNPRGLVGPKKFEDPIPFHEDYDVSNWYSSSVNSHKGEKYAPFSRSKNFTATRSHPMEDYPNPLYRDEGFESPVAGNHYKYPKNPKYRSYESSRYVPEIEDWVVDAYHKYEHVGRSEMSGRTWLEENNAYGHSGRKIDLTGGSLRVTIKNC